MNGGEEDVGDAIVNLYINKRKADFSNAELKSLRAAIVGKHVNPTHFADPGYEVCYRSP